MKPRVLLTALLLMLAAVTASAQTTKVRGRVVDEQGEGIPFVAVLFEGTTVGITTDLDGYYNLENKDLSNTVLVAQLLGYESARVNVRPGVFNQTDFTLRLFNHELAGAQVKADNKKAKRLLANINARRSKNDPDSHPQYRVKIYNKMELGLTHPQEQLQNTVFEKKFDFVFDYIDTSAVSGVPYLPVMISETVADKHHSSNPELNTEKVEANRISGVNPDLNLLSQFTGSMHLKVNFYNDFINAFDVQFPSPIMPAAMLYYNYYIIDSLQLDGRKTLVVRYHPKKFISTPTFDGEMQIDAEDFALRSIRATMKNTVNVNWLRDFELNASYQRMPDSTWFYKSDGFYVDFSMSLRDSSKMLSFLGKRELTYGEPDFDFVPEIKGSDAPVKVAVDAGHQSEEFWEAARPAPLTKKEEDVYAMVDEIKTIPLYKDLYTITYTLINSYWDIGKIGIGPYYKLVSFNQMEGFRPQFGLRTSKDFSKTDRFTVYAAYGIKDKTLKGGGEWEHLFSREPWIKLNLEAKYDVYQIGAGNHALTEGNMFASIFGGSYGTRPCMMSSFKLNYEQEVNPSFTFGAGLNFSRYYGTGELFVPMIATSGRTIPSVAKNEFQLMAIFSKDETVNKGYFIKQSVHSNYPIIRIDLSAGIPGIRKYDYGYFRPELSINWKWRLPPFGMSKIWANAGTIIGRVPYPLLHIHEGNSTYLLSRQAFSCMDFFEFASDTWATVFWYHSLGGYIFGKIPIIRELNLREEFSLRATWGSLSERNNGNPGESQMRAPMRFPKMIPGDPTSPYMRSLGKVPFVEFGAGISNILRFIRIDCFWRLTHRDDMEGVEEQQTGEGIFNTLPKRFRTTNFAVNIGAEFRF